MSANKNISEPAVTKILFFFCIVSATAGGLPLTCWSVSKRAGPATYGGIDETVSSYTERRAVSFSAIRKSFSRATVSRGQVRHVPLSPPIPHQKRKEEEEPDLGCWSCWLSFISPTEMSQDTDRQRDCVSCHIKLYMCI